MTKILVPLVMFLASCAGFIVAVQEGAPLGMIMMFGFATIALSTLEKEHPEAARAIRKAIRS